MPDRTYEAPDPPYEAPDPPLHWHFIETHRDLLGFTRNGADWLIEARIIAVLGLQCLSRIDVRSDERRHALHRASGGIRRGSSTKPPPPRSEVDEIQLSEQLDNHDRVLGLLLLAEAIRRLEAQRSKQTRKRRFFGPSAATIVIDKVLALLLRVDGVAYLRSTVRADEPLAEIQAHLTDSGKNLLREHFDVSD